MLSRLRDEWLHACALLCAVQGIMLLCAGWTFVRAGRRIALSLRRHGRNISYRH